MKHSRGEMLVSPALLQKLISYDRDNGTFTWLERPIDMFHDTCGGNITAQAACSNWNKRYAGKPALRRMRPSTGVMCGAIMDYHYAAHRAAWAIHYGQWPAQQVDHIDGNPSNNRLSNLRLADAVTNARNQGLGVANSSGVLGVSWCTSKSKWVASINAGGKKVALGAYVTKAEAAAARIGAERVIGYHPNHGARPSYQARALRGSGERGLNIDHGDMF